MKRKISFGDLVVSEKSKEHLEDCVKTNRISGGLKVPQLEKKWEELFGYKYNLAVNNGTGADIAACMTLYDFGAQPGDEIIAPAMAFVAVGNSIRAAGFTPTFVDIKRDTLNINPNLIEEKITPKTRAIMAVHTMGKPCDMEKITTLADE